MAMSTAVQPHHRQRRARSAPASSANRSARRTNVVLSTPLENTQSIRSKAGSPTQARGSTATSPRFPPSRTLRGWRSPCSKTRRPGALARLRATASDRSMSPGETRDATLGSRSRPSKRANINSTRSISGGKSSMVPSPPAACRSRTNAAISPGRMAIRPSAATVPGRMASINKAPLPSSDSRIFGTRPEARQAASADTSSMPRVRSGESLRTTAPSSGRSQSNTQEFEPLETERMTVKPHRRAR